MNTGCLCQINSFVGGYYDAHQQRAEAKPIRQVAAKVEETKAAAPVKSNAPAAKRPGKLSYNLQRELDQLPQQLEKLENEIGGLQAQVSHADFFSRPHEETQQVLKALADAEQALDVAFSRWEELEAQKNG